MEFVSISRNNTPSSPDHQLISIYRNYNAGTRVAHRPSGASPYWCRKLTVVKCAGPAGLICREYEYQTQGRERGGTAGRASTDDSVFALRGVPAPRFSVMTDFDYARVHHTQADTYENVLPFRAAQQYSALAIALIAYEVANAEQDISRAGYYR